MTILDQLELHEGRRRFPYVDTVGKISIGVGRNLTDVGLSDEEIDGLLINDLRAVMADLRVFPWWEGLPDRQRRALVDLRFNLGPARFRKWKATLSCVDRGDFVGAARQFRTNRKYFAQVGQRAEHLALLLEGIEPAW